MILSFMLRILLAGCLGLLIGIEREYRAKEAGHRTHFLVALGSSLLMIISQYGFDDVLSQGNSSYDPSRIAAQVVTGIGFIGAGTIILKQNYVRGLTTAAGIWATSAIGLAVGAGMYLLGIVSTLFVLIGLETINLFQTIPSEKYIKAKFKIKQIEDFNNLYNTLKKKGIQISQCEIHKEEDNSYSILIHIQGRLDWVNKVISSLEEDSNISIVSILV